MEPNELTDEQLLCADEHLWGIFLKADWCDVLLDLVSEIQTLLYDKGLACEREQRP